MCAVIKGNRRRNNNKKKIYIYIERNLDRRRLIAKIIEMEREKEEREERKNERQTDRDKASGRWIETDR